MHSFIHLHQHIAVHLFNSLDALVPGQQFDRQILLFQNPDLHSRTQLGPADDLVDGKTR